MRQVPAVRAAASSWPLATAAALALCALIEVTWRQPAASVAHLMALAVTVPVALCRSAPSVAAGLLASGVLLTQLSGSWMACTGLAALALTYAVLGLRASTRSGVLYVAPFVAYVCTPAAVHTTGGRSLGVVLVGVTGAAVAVGAVRRSRAEAARRDVADRAIADTLLEHAARGERARIARELHDVVAHHLSMIAVLAEAARLTTPGMPDQGAVRLVAIGDTARTALTEMRRLLGVLREDAGGEPTRRPLPGLQQLNELLDEVRDVNGTSTRLIVRGRVAPLDEGIELTAYRIVQEALTNARRHATGAAVDVELIYGDTALHLRIRDNGPGTAAGGADQGGHGITGMQERAAMLGGKVTAGPGSAGGFLIEATLPTAREAT